MTHCPKPVDADLKFMMITLFHTEETFTSCMQCTQQFAEEFLKQLYRKYQNE